MKNSKKIFSSVLLSSLFLFLLFLPVGEIKAGPYFNLGSGAKPYTGTSNMKAEKPSAGIWQAVEDTPEVEVNRLFGEDRYDTAVEISKKFYPNGAKEVILAREDLFPDALAASSLAGKYDCPILLTQTEYLNPDTLEEIKRLKAEKVYIMGTEDAVSSQVEAELQSQCSIKKENIVRIGGVDRYETAALIAQELGAQPNHKAIVATGLNFPDALAASSLAAYEKMPILLVNESNISPAMQEALKNLNINRSIIVGGPDVVPDGIASWLDTNGYRAMRLFGDDRYGTCVKIAECAELLGMEIDGAYFVGGYDFPDALCAGPNAGKEKKLLLLTRKDNLPEIVKSFLFETLRNFFLMRGKNISSINIIGGNEAISQEGQGSILNVMELTKPNTGLTRIALKNNTNQTRTFNFSGQAVAGLGPQQSYVLQGPCFYNNEFTLSVDNRDSVLLQWDHPQLHHNFIEFHTSATQYKFNFAVYCEWYAPKYFWDDKGMEWDGMNWHGFIYWLYNDGTAYSWGSYRIVSKLSYDASADQPSNRQGIIIYYGNDFPLPDAATVTIP